MMPSRLVWPPSAQRSGWCRWHLPGGASQPSTSQPPASMVLAMRWASLWKRGAAAEVEDLGLAAEDGGDDPGFAGQPAGGAGGDGFAGVEVGCFESAHQGLDGIRTTAVALRPPALGRLLGGVALDEFDEGLAEPLGGGAAFAEGSLGGLVLGGGDREQGLLEHGAGEAGVDGESAVGLAVPVVPDHQPGGGLGVAFLASNRAGFVGVGGVGVDDLEDPAAEDLQRLGVMDFGQLEQVPLGLVDEVGVEVGRGGRRGL